MIATLSGTIVVESIVILAYAQLAKKPILPLLVTSFLANCLTQALLWAALWTFPFHYWLTLISMEILIVGSEFLIFYANIKNQLRWNEALRLALIINLASFSVGWFLRI